MQVDERTSASSMVDARGNDRRRRERDLPKDAASLHWYDAEGTSYHSAESQARKEQQSPSEFFYFPCRHPFSVCSSPPRGGWHT